MGREENPLSEGEIAMVLDTFMYMNYQGARDGESLSAILKGLENQEDYQPGGAHYGEYTILKQAAKNKEIGELKIGCQSANMGFDTGTCACTFSSPDKSCVYVVYRGTGDGEWPDNGKGMTQESTLQQERALEYFEAVSKELAFSENQRVIVTGHSKGGNKAQFVTMSAKNGKLIDCCYSVDGQGFSQEAVEKWKKTYGEIEYQERIGKLRGICGENDYVNVLGMTIIPMGQIRYVSTPVEKQNFAGYHDIKYLFASLERTEAKDGWMTVFHGRKNPDVLGQGVLAEYAAALSAAAMAMDRNKRDGCAAVLMQLMEGMQGTKQGLNGEKLSLSDIGDFASEGISMLLSSLLKEKEGRNLLYAFWKRELLSEQLPGMVVLEVKKQILREQATVLSGIGKKLENHRQRINEIRKCMPLYINGNMAVNHRISRVILETEKIEKRLQALSCHQEEAAEAYERWERDWSERIVDFFHGIG